MFTGNVAWLLTQLNVCPVEISFENMAIPVLSPCNFANVSTVGKQRVVTVPKYAFLGMF